MAVHRNRRGSNLLMLCVGGLSCHRAFTHLEEAARAQDPLTLSILSSGGRLSGFLKSFGQISAGGERWTLYGVVLIRCSV